KMTRKRLQFLYERYQQRVISDDELVELRQYISDDTHRARVEEWLDGTWDDLSEETLSDMPRERQRALFKAMTGVGLGVNPLRYFWYAAAVVFLISGSILLFRYVDRFDDKALLTLETDALEDISPGTNKAILTLADGKQV